MERSPAVTMSRVCRASWRAGPQQHRGFSRKLADAEVDRPLRHVAALRTRTQLTTQNRAKLLHEGNGAYRRLTALGQQVPRPLQLHWPGSAAALPADDQPVGHGRARVVGRVAA